MVTQSAGVALQLDGYQNYAGGFPSTINNLAGATWDIQGEGDGGFTPTQGGYDYDVVNNDGTFEKTGGAGTATLGPAVTFGNTGTVGVQAGTLVLLSGSSVGGVMQVSANGQLQMQNFSVDGSMIDIAAGTLPTAGIYDLGNVTIGGPLVVSLGYAPAPGSVITLIHSAAAIGGTFDSLPEGASLEVDGRPFTISYVGGAGRDLTITSSDTAASLGGISGWVFGDSAGSGVSAATGTGLPGVAVYLDTNNNGKFDPAKS